MSHRCFTAVVTLVLAVLLAATLLGLRSPAIAQSAVPAAKWVSDEILIKFRPEARDSDRLAGLTLLDAVRRHKFQSGAEQWRIPNSLSVEDAIETMKSNPLVEYAEPNHIGTLADSCPSDDPFYANGQQWNLETLGLAEAWCFTSTGGAGWLCR